MINPRRRATTLSSDPANEEQERELKDRQRTMLGYSADVFSRTEALLVARQVDFIQVLYFLLLFIIYAHAYSWPTSLLEPCSHCSISASCPPRRSVTKFRAWYDTKWNLDNLQYNYIALYLPYVLDILDIKQRYEKKGIASGLVWGSNNRGIKMWRYRFVRPGNGSV
jgi:hypothetical protein